MTQSKKGSLIISAESLRTRRQWNDIFIVLKEKKKKLNHPRRLYLSKIVLKNEGKIKVSLEKQTLREFITTILDLRAMLKELLKMQPKAH